MNDDYNIVSMNGDALEGIINMFLVIVQCTCNKLCVNWKQSQGQCFGMSTFCQYVDDLVKSKPKNYSCLGNAACEYYTDAFIC